MAHSSDNDDSRRRRNPFQKLKRVINNLRTPRSRSTSPATLRSTISFTSGFIYHAHSIPEPSSTPSKYLLLAVSHEGQLLDISTQNTNNIGYITCQCKSYQLTTHHKKIIAFITSAHPPRLSKGEHYVDSPFVFPQLTPAQKSISKSYPLFFKLPQAYSDNTPLVEEQAMELKSVVLARLQELTDHVDQNEIDHVYTQLFATSQLDSNTDDQSQSSQDSQESEDSDGSRDSPLPPPESPPPPATHSSIPKPGVLIYAHHNQSLKNFTRKELYEVFKILSHSKQDKVHRKLQDAGHPIAGIYINSSSHLDTTQVFAITLRDMRILQHNIFYKTVTKNTLTYTFALLSEIHAHAPLVTQTAQILDSRHFIEHYRTLIMAPGTTGNPNPLDSSNHRHRAPASKNQRKKAKQKKSKSKSKKNKKHSPDSPYLTDSSSSSTSSSTETDLVSPERTQSTNSILQKQTYQPPILGDSTCPQTYHTFWKLKAKTRKLPPSNKKLVKYVAPRFPLTMLQLTEQVNYPDLLSREFVAYAQAYDSIVKQKNYASIVTLPLYTVGVENSESDLAITGQTRILDSLKRKAPQLETKSLDKLTESALTQFFFIARTYMLTSSIPWDSFSDYFLTPNILGSEIYAKVTNALIGYPTHKELLKNLSCFIERIIFRLLPVQESYYDAEVRILEKHKQYLTGPNPSIDFTKTYIHSDAQELTTKSPYYKQVHTEITDEQLRMMIENEKTNLLHKIITHTSYDAKIHKLLIASSKYKEITDVPNNELLDNVQSLMVAEEKTAIALVNATKLSPISSTPRTTRRGKTQTTTTSPKARNRSQSRDSNSKGARRQAPTRSASRSPHTKRNLSSRHPSYSPERRRNNSKPQLQERCDTCLKLSMPEEFCHKNRHCRRDGHQPDYRKSSELERRVQRNEPDTFVTYENCTKCFPPTPRPTKWLHGTTSSQVLIPPNYFGRPPPNYVQLVNTNTPPMSTWQPPPSSWQQPYQEYHPYSYNHTQQHSHNPNPASRSSPNQGELRHKSPYRRQSQSHQGTQDHQDKRQNSKR